MATTASVRACLHILHCLRARRPSDDESSYNTSRGFSPHVTTAQLSLPYTTQCQTVALNQQSKLWT